MYKPMPMCLNQRPGHLLLLPSLKRPNKVFENSFQRGHSYVYIGYREIGPEPGFYYYPKGMGDKVFYCSSPVRVFQALVSSPITLYYSRISEEGVIVGGGEEASPILFQYVPPIQWMFG